MRRVPDRRRATGRRGEGLAALHLRLKGYRIEVRNWRCPLGELDIVAWDGDTLVFVEVKTRASSAVGAPEDAVTVHKRRRLVRLAQAFLAQRGSDLPPCRFDVVAVDTGKPWPRLRHFRNAFQAEE